MVDGINGPNNQPKVQSGAANKDQGLQNAARAVIQGIFDWKNMDIKQSDNNAMKGWQVEHTYGYEDKQPIEPAGKFVEYSGSTNPDDLKFTNDLD